MTVPRSVPQNAEHQVNGLVADDCETVVSSQVMVLLIVVDQLAVGVESLDPNQLGLEDAANTMLNMSQALRNVHLEESEVGLIVEMMARVSR